ncbi:MAG: hypothetical protein KAS72_10470 [Phycisphaerales bacterium]|nr:hypothetical protein [Phycisphaerales bacterium]
MDKAVKFALFGLVLIVLILFMTTYTVRYDQFVIVTTFGKVSEASHAREQGLHFKLPTPIQRVRRLDKRTRVLESRLEDHQTKDHQQITLRAYLAWRISDPVRYFQSYSGRRADRDAEDTLDDRLRSAMGSVSEYEFAELLAPVEADSKLDELEQKLLSRVRKAEDDQLTLKEELGIEIVDVGITRIILPETTTKKVFQRMRAVRERLAESALSKGEALKGEIINRADSNAKSILSYAAGLAAEIRARGDREATPWIAKMSQDEELAMYTLAVEAIESMVTKQATLIVSMKDFPFNLWSPTVLQGEQGHDRIPTPPMIGEADEAEAQPVEQDEPEDTR